MTRHSARWATLLTVVAISAGCGGSDDAADGFDTDAEMQGAEDGESYDDYAGQGEFEYTMSGAMTGEVSGTDVVCAELGDTRTVTATGVHNGQTLYLVLSNETFDDGTSGKVMIGSYARGPGQGGTLTIDEDGATFEDLEVEEVTITGHARC